MSHTNWKHWLGYPLALTALAALTACSSDYPTAGVVENGGDAPSYAPPAPTQSALAPDPSSGGGGGDDALQSGDDPLAAQHGGVSSSDPLAGDDDDPLTSSALDPDADPLGKGRPMPTDHSHWLDGTITGAWVTVELNHAPYGTFEAPIDKDITMHLRRGVNTVTFKFVPQSTMAAVNLQVEESEHDPPIPPLAIFHPPLPLDGETPKPLTRTFTFIAH